MDVLTLIYTFSYLGFFILGFLSTAIPFFSPPLYLSLPLILYKTNLSKILATILTALGMATGEIVSYSIGYAGEKAIDKKIRNNYFYKKFSNALDKYGLIILPLLSAIPFPFFDIVGMSYGFAKVDIKTFFIFVFAGKLIKTSFVVILGSYILTYLPFKI